MQTTTVSRDATGLPAFISTPAKRRPKAAKAPGSTASPEASTFKPGVALPVEELDDKFLEPQPDGTHVLTPCAEPTLLPTTGLTYEQTQEVWPLLSTEVREASRWERVLADTFDLVPRHRVDPAGIVRDWKYVPETAPGTVTPLCQLDLHIDIPAHDEAGIIGMGLAAAAWAGVGGEPTTEGRDVAIVLIEDACPNIPDSTLSELYCIAEHELQPARDRVAVRLASDPDFTAKFGRARAIMTAASVYFPWNEGDGTIPW